MNKSPNAIDPARDRQLAQLATMIVGLEKHEQQIPTFVIAGKQYTVAEVIAALQARHDVAQAVLTTKADWQAAVKADHNSRASGKVFLNGVRQTLLAAFAGSVNTLADFGLTARKAPVVSPEKRVAAAQKAKATRAARHTLGKKQKAAIKGTVPVTAPATSPGASPVTAPAAVTTPATAPAVATPVAPATPVTAPAATLPAASAPPAPAHS